MKASLFRLKTMIGSWNTRSKSPVGEIDEISKVGTRPLMFLLF